MRSLWLAVCLTTFGAFAESPVSLTASDGSGLKLVSYTAHAVVEDPLAFTELVLVFENPQDRVIEGQFRVTLPRGATVSRFAMKLDGRWQEGEVVEKQAARRAYEDFLHRRQDPALLEQAAGNEFSARVFPIPAKGRKEVIVSWSHELRSADAPYTLPLKGLPQIGALDVQVSSGGVSLASLQKTGFVPDKDIVVAPPRTGRTGIRAGDLIVTRVKAVATSTPEPMPSLLLLVDTSASRALGFDNQLMMVRKVLERLAQTNPTTTVTVAGFDQAVRVAYEGAASGFPNEKLNSLRERRALGASNVSGALQWALERGKKAPVARLVLVTDGVFTAGEIEGDQLLASVARLKDAGVQRLDAIAVGGIREEDALRRLVTAKLPKTGAVLDGDLAPEVLVRRLLETTVAKVPVTAEGAKVVWPLALEGVQAGDEAVVVLEAAGESPVVKVGAVTVELKKGLAGIEKPLLERAWAQAKIQALLEQQDRVADGPEQKKKLREEMIALSIRHRVLCPLTALLVLETEADYARFHIDRKALADILTVDKGRLSLLHRGPETVTASKPLPPRQDEPDTKAKLKPAKMDVADKRSSHEEKPSDSVEKPEPMAEAKEAERSSTDEAKKEEAPARPMERRMNTIQVIRGAPSAEPPAAPPPPPPRPGPRPAADRRPMPGSTESNVLADEDSAAGMPLSREPWEGPFKEVMVALGAKQTQKALDRAKGWREEQPGDVLALVALGEALEASNELEQAARAYGSIIDLFPARADLRRFAGVRLERIKDAGALALAADTFAKAAEQRPDHPASHRFLAFALLRAGKFAEAFKAIERGASLQYPEGRFRGAEQILREDAGLIAAAWLKAEPGVAIDLRARLAKLNAKLEDQPSLRFVLTWETDANDVDFHILDPKGGHAFYSAMHLPSGGDLYADVTTGYGPECFTIRLPVNQRSYPYKLRAHYYSRGPMGYGMGKLEIIDHDGKGGLKFEQRPYVVMVDSAFVNLGVVKAPGQ